MNIHKIETQLREKARVIKLHLFMLRAHMGALETKKVYQDAACVTAQGLEQFADARFHDREADKLEAALKSLSQIEYAMVRDQKSIGLVIQRIKSFNGRKAKFVEPNKMIEATLYTELLEEAVIQLSRTYDYRTRHYEFGAGW
ncbi:hypothetical protein Acj9p061 [Acinetobacter phage Acj9]|uniref:Uncharacterized protein n=1 Tax=Acinetobacter phage Acj9 TaxID=760939 RepID=E5EPJ5_9CAUD|nr:hypothetical protein Acj9p061 [Acinetobacter phage Acj9]ADG59961.1 hypothetical protein Acj9p061 [Acinetobacter phage Acj9]